MCWSHVWATTRCRILLRGQGRNVIKKKHINGQNSMNFLFKKLYIYNCKSPKKTPYFGAMNSICTNTILVYTVECARKLTHFYLNANITPTSIHKLNLRTPANTCPIVSGNICIHDRGPTGQVSKTHSETPGQRESLIILCNVHTNYFR